MDVLDDDAAGPWVRLDGVRCNEVVVLGCPPLENTTCDKISGSLIQWLISAEVHTVTP